MNRKRLVMFVITLAVLSLGAFFAYRTQSNWKQFLFPVSNKSDIENHPSDHDHETPIDRVKLSPQAQQNLGLDSDTLSPQAYWKTVLIPGIIVDRPGESDRNISAKTAGIISEIHAKPGDIVKPGDKLFTMQLVSEFLQSVQTELAKAAKELEFATAKRDRIADLVRRGTQSEAILIEEENQVKRLTTQGQTFRKQLLLFGLTKEQVNKIEKGEIITEFTILVPGLIQTSLASTNNSIVFEIQELKVSLGEQVQAGQTLCLLANHQKLFVEGRAFKSESDILANATLKKLPIRVEFPDEAIGVWPKMESLSINHLSNLVDQSSRTFGFYLPLENQSKSFVQDGKTRFVWRFQPGQQVRLRVPTEELFTLASDGKKRILPFVLPAGAVVREGPEAFVFVQKGNSFARKSVQVLASDHNEFVIANDGSLSEADYVVRNQAAAINRALKVSMGSAGGNSGHDGHGHSHDH